jgi:hypothetical protein
MGTTLTGTTPQDTYDSLIKVTDNGPISSTLKALSDGLGNDSALALSTGAASITGTLAVSGDATFDTNTLFVDAANNRVGVGITTPDSKVRIQNDNATVPSLTIRDGGTPTVDHIRVSSGTYGDAFFVGATGNVGIGTSEPNYKLEVLGGVISTYQGGLTALKTYTKAVGFQVSSYQSVNGGPFTKTTDLVANADSGVPSEMRFLTAPAGGNPTEVARFLSTGGLTFNGDTAAANALDDYEEGTWTMGVSFGGASVGVVYGSNTGTYTKIGRQVTVNGLLQLTSKGSSTGNVTITGLPFTVGGVTSYYATSALRFKNIAFVNQYQGYANPTTTNVILEETTNLGAITAITHVEFANNSEVIIGLTYFV